MSTPSSASKSQAPLGHQFFDFETRPKDDAFLLGYHGPFDRANFPPTEATIKKGPAAIDTHYAECEAAYLPELRENAAKNPETCEMCASGHVDLATGKNEIVLGTEKEILEDHLARVEALAPGAEMIGWNNDGYDDPLVVAAAIRNNVKLPDRMVQKTANGTRYLTKRKDLMHVYTGEPTGYAKLERASSEAGGPRKVSHGAYFHADLDSGDPARRNLALFYLYQDNVMPVFVQHQLVDAGLLDMPKAKMPIEASVETAEQFIVPPRKRVEKEATSPIPDIDQSRSQFFMLLQEVRSDDELLAYFGEFDAEHARGKATKEARKKGEPGILEYIEKKRIAHVNDMRKSAAKDPNGKTITAAIYAGIKTGEFEIVLGSEAEIVEDHFARYVAMGPNDVMMGWDSAKEDDYTLAAAARRAGIPFPSGMAVTRAGYRSLTQRVDLMQTYAGGPRESQDLSATSSVVGGHRSVMPRDEISKLVTNSDPAARQAGCVALCREAAMPIKIYNRMVSSGLLDMPAAIEPTMPEVNQAADLLDVEALIVPPQKRVGKAVRMAAVEEDDILFGPTPPGADAARAKFTASAAKASLQVATVQ
jgi:hypothetical protein